jgi:hypothetical protein
MNTPYRITIFSLKYFSRYGFKYKGSSKKFRTYVFLKKMERARGMGLGGIVGCHVTSWQDKPVDLAVSVRVATNW